MLPMTEAHEELLAHGVQAEHVRVFVKDGGGFFRDLTTYAGVNMVKTVTWRENVDDPHATFAIELHREQFLLSLSPLMTTSPLNLGFNPAASYSALIAVAREIYIEVAIVAMDRAPEAADWFEVFRGKIDTFDVGRGEVMEIAGRALSGRLAQQYIKEERVYSFASVSGTAVAMRLWQPETTYYAGTYLLPASRGEDDPGFNRFFVCATSGTTGTTEPTWSTGTGITDGTAVWDYVGAPTTSGNPVEEIMQNILDDNVGLGDAPVTLFTPVTPGWNITQFLQQRTFTLEAIRALALQIGWDLRYKWNPDEEEWALTFYGPDRDATTPLWTFAPGDYGDPSQLSVDIAEIRNSWRGIYTDAADLWPDGRGKRKVVEVTDSDSINKYGELWAEIQEDASSQIDSEAEMLDMLDAALSDCAEPTAVVSMPLINGFPWTEINDLYEFTAPTVSPKYFDVDQTLAVTGWQQTFENGKLKTVLSLRGKPTLGAMRWIGAQFHPNAPPPQAAHRMAHFEGPTTATFAVSDNIVGGQQFHLSQDFDKTQIRGEYEVHVYETPSSTLDATTLAGVSSSPIVSLPNLEPGKTYYSRAVPRFHNAERLVRGQPTNEISFVAGRAYAGHIQSGIALGEYPLNGGFETRYNTGAMPDHWGMFGGTFGVDAEIIEDGSGLSGKRYLRLTGGGVFTGDFPVIAENMEANRESSLYRATWWRKSGAGVDSGTDYEIQLLWFDYAGAGTQTGLFGPADASGILEHWVKEEVIFELPGDARNIAFAITAGGAGTDEHIDIDEMRCQYLGTSWFDIGNTTSHTDSYLSIPGFDNSYAWFGSSDSKPAFRRDQFGRVILKGAFAHATTSTVGSSLFTLPAGFRPPRKLSFLCQANGQAGLIEISTAGAVTLVSADNANPSTKVSLDGIVFEAHE